MNVEEATRIIQSNPQKYFNPDKSKKGYICPICGSGSGKNGTGIAENPKEKHRYKCFSCGAYGDVIDFISQAEHISLKDAFKKACELNGIKRDTDFNTLYTDNKQVTQDTHNTHKEPTEAELKAKEALQALYKQDIEEASLNLEDIKDYIAERGLSLDTAYKYKLGYFPNWTNPDYRGKGKVTPRLIIPTSETSYTARNLEKNIDKTERYKHIGGTHIFNETALYGEGKTCFITEGEIDALSVIECGFNCIGLGSASNTNLLTRTLKNRPSEKDFIIYFDNDDTGKRDSEKVFNALKELGYRVSNITGKEESYNDANDYLRAFRESLKQFLQDAVEEADLEKQEAKQAYLNETNTISYVADFLEFVEGAKNSVSNLYTPTGFKELDKLLDGGLYEGLYILGAISSLGKTTFILQVADQIAKSGQDVLFFSLEQARAELMAKSISRETYLYCDEAHLNKYNAKNIRDLTVADRYKKYDETELGVIKHAISRYRQTAKNMFIFEGVADITVAQIQQAVERHIELTGKKPIVFIDYLQIVAPASDKGKTDKQITDLNITNLKRLSRSLRLAIVGVSSFNRDNYNTSVNLGSFKESGAIEYSSDVLIGLQFKGIDDLKQTEGNTQKIRDFIEEAKNKNPREVELKILKNRSGKTSTRAEYKYFPEYNLYKEVTEEERIADEAFNSYKQAKGRY